jgi:hypothetical protein
MPSDPFLFLSPADKRIITKARKRSPKALDAVARALARKTIDLANRKDRQCEKDLADDTDRSGFEEFLTRPLRRRGVVSTGNNSTTGGAASK